MKCKSCNNEIDDDSVFFKHCGNRTGAYFVNLGLQSGTNWKTIGGSYIYDTCGNRTFTIGDVSFKIIQVQGGTFTMGDATNLPLHDVTLSEYYIGETEVTQELWEAVMGNLDNPTKFETENLPKGSVSYDDALNFIDKLNSITEKSLNGLFFSLPTEAQWEYAARGGKKSRGCRYSGSNDPDVVSWNWRNSGDKYLTGAWSKDNVNNNNNRTHPVKQKSPNELGIYDMNGNVIEWCSDWRGDYSAKSQTNPAGPPEGNQRICRGGTYYGSDVFSVSDRFSSTSSVIYKNFGFRIVLQRKSDVSTSSFIPDRKSRKDEKIQVKDVKFKMIWVQGGLIEGVKLDGYYMGETEVTQELWEAVMGSNPSRWKGEKRPVDSVSWYDAQEFIYKLNNMTGRKFRLPTEYEWYYAAKGGSKSNRYTYSGSNDSEDVHFYAQESKKVKQKKPNELGIYDMSCNVSEWCDDLEKVKNYTSMNDYIGYIHNFRGGNFKKCHKLDQYWETAGRYKSSYLGLRLVMEP